MMAVQLTITLGDDNNVSIKAPGGVSPFALIGLLDVAKSLIIKPIVHPEKESPILVAPAEALKHLPKSNIVE